MYIATNDELERNTAFPRGLLKTSHIIEDSFSGTKQVGAFVANTVRSCCIMIALAM